MRSSLLLAVVLALLAAASSWRTSDEYPGSDFYLHWCVAQVVDDPAIGDIYSKEGQARIAAAMQERAADKNYQLGAAISGRGALTELTKRHSEPRVIASPFLYAVFATCTGDHYDSSYFVYRCLSMLCTLFAILVFARVLGMSWTTGWLAFALFTAPFEPFLSILRTGNVSQFQLAALALLVLLETRARKLALGAGLLEGVILGLLLAFKINLLGCALLLVLDRLFHRRFGALTALLVGAASGIVLAVLASAAVFAQDGAWQAWQFHLSTFASTARTAAEGNYSITTIAGDTDPQAIGFVLFAVLLGAGAVFEFLLRRRRGNTYERTRRDEIRVLGIGCIVGILGAPLTWLHYYNLAIPLGLYCIARLPDGLRPPRFDAPLRVLAMGCMLSIGLTVFIQIGGGASPDVYAHLCYWPTLALLGLVAIRELATTSLPGTSGPSA